MTTAITTAKKFLSGSTTIGVNKGGPNKKSKINNIDMEIEDDKNEIDLTKQQMISKKVKIEMMETNVGEPNTLLKAPVPEVIKIQDEEEVCGESLSSNLTNDGNGST